MRRRGAFTLAFHSKTSPERPTKCFTHLNESRKQTHQRLNWTFGRSVGRSNSIRFHSTFLEAKRFALLCWKYRNNRVSLLCFPFLLVPPLFFPSLFSFLLIFLFFPFLFLFFFSLFISFLFRFFSFSFSFLLSILAFLYFLFISFPFFSVLAFLRGSLPVLPCIRFESTPKRYIVASYFPSC